MSLNSTLAVLLCNLKVSIKHNKPINRCIFSNLNVSALIKLSHSGIVKAFKVREIRKGIKEIEFELATINGEIVLNDIKMISKPGQRIYVGAKFGEFIRYIKFYDLAVVSTPKGLLTHKECVKESVGGELMFVYR